MLVAPVAREENVYNATRANVCARATPVGDCVRATVKVKLASRPGAAAMRVRSGEG